ncbi:MAG: SCO family protein [Aestuariivirga sp.]
MAAVFGVLYFQGEEVRNKLASVAEIGGPFRLASSNGGLVDSKELLGRPYGIFFGFTHCPEVCPTTLYEMTKTLAAVGDEAREFRLFFITVDPERDTAPMLKDYLSNFDPRMEALVPTPDELSKVAKEFRAIYEKVPASDGEYTMNHTATIFLMNGEGRLASTISYSETPENRIAKIKKLIAGG